MQQSIIDLAKLGPLPSSVDPDLEKIEKMQKLIECIQSPITDVEARVLINIFGPDDCFGLSWTILHLIESSPGWPLYDCLIEPKNEWIRRLRDRSEK
jgi:hypothetical protein